METDTFDCDHIYAEYVNATFGYEDANDRANALYSKLLVESNHSISFENIQECIEGKSTLNVTYDDCNGLVRKLGMIALFDPEAVNASTIKMMKKVVLDSGGKMPLEAVVTCFQAMSEDLDASNSPKILIPFFALNCIFAAFGILGNIALCLTYFKKNRNLRFNQLMITLATFDFLCLISGIIHGGLQISDNLAEYKVIRYIYFGFVGASVYTAIAICLERYLILCHERKTDKYSIGWTIILILSIGFGMGLSVVVGYGGHFIFTWFIGITIIPSFMLITFNVLLYRKFKRIERSGTIVGKAGDGLRKSMFKVKMSMVISASFVSSQIAYLIYGSYTIATFSFSIWLTVLSKLSEFFFVLNCSLNYYLYRFLIWKEKKGTNGIELQSTYERTNNSTAFTSLNR